MRLLTIKRNRAFAGWAMKAQIYIEDPFAPETDICGVPCKLLGTLKNNEQKSFPIGLESRRIFVITKLKHRDLYNTPFTIPYGQEDVFLSGKYCLETDLLVPFRFDGIAPSQEQLTRERKMKNRNAIVVVCSSLAAFLLVVLLNNIDFGSESKTFRKGDFSITLTEDFQESELEDLYVCYESNYVGITVLQESKADIGYMSLPGYAKLLIKLNGYNLTLQESDGLVWCSYTESVDGMNYYYQVYFYDSDEAFWTVNFCVPAGKQNEYESKFSKWAESVKIAQAA